MSFTESAIRLANSLLMQYSVPRVIYSLSECDSIVFVSLYEAISKSFIAYTNRFPATPTEHRENFVLVLNAILNYLPEGLNLNHIQADALLNRHPLTINNLLEVMSLLAEVFSGPDKFAYHQSLPVTSPGAPPIYPGLGTQSQYNNFTSLPANYNLQYRESFVEFDQMQAKLNHMCISPSNQQPHHLTDYSHLPSIEATRVLNNQTSVYNNTKNSQQSVSKYQIHVSVPTSHSPTGFNDNTNVDILSRHTSLDSIEMASIEPTLKDHNLETDNNDEGMDSNLNTRPPSPTPPNNVIVPDFEDPPLFSIPFQNNLLDEERQIPKDNASTSVPQVAIFAPTPESPMPESADILPRLDVPQPTQMSEIETFPDELNSPAHEATLMESNQDSENLQHTSINGTELIQNISTTPINNKSPHTEKNPSRIKDKTTPIKHTMKSPGKLKPPSSIGKREAKVKFSRSTESRDRIRNMAKGLNENLLDINMTSSPIPNSDKIYLDEKGVDILEANEEKNGEVRRDVLKYLYKQYIKEVKQSQKEKMSSSRVKNMSSKPSPIMRSPPTTLHEQTQTHDTSDISGLEEYLPTKYRKVKVDEDIFPIVREEFPYMELSPSDQRRLWLKQMKQISAITKSAMPSKKCKQHRELLDAEKRQLALIEILQKDLQHARNTKDMQQKAHIEQTMKTNLRDHRIAQAKSKQYYRDYEIRLRDKLQRKRTREELIYRHIFEDALQLQKSRMREIREYAKEKQAMHVQRQKDALESLENYYRDRFTLLQEQINQEGHDQETRFRTENVAIRKMRHEIRSKLEKEIKQLQECIEEADNDTHFREIDAQRYRDQLRATTFLAPIK